MVLRRPGLATVILPAGDFEVAAHGIQRKVRMRPAAELTGRVTNQAGEPVAGATVVAGGLAGFFVLEGANAVKTDAEGRFRFADLVAFDRATANKREAEANVWATSWQRDDSKRFPPVFDPAEATSAADRPLTISVPVRSRTKTPTTTRIPRATLRIVQFRYQPITKTREGEEIREERAC